MKPIQNSNHHQKTLLVVLFLFIAFGFSNAQSVKKKTVNSDDFKEVYYIDRITKIQHGYYTKFHKETKVEVVSGEYYKGMRFGKWTFKDPITNKIQLEYNFTDKKLVHLDSKQYPDSFLVKIDDAFVYTKVDRPLTFIGYRNEEKQILKAEILVPRTIKESGLTGKSTIQFLVNEDGNIAGSKVISSWNEEMEQKINSVINAMNGRFLPAIVNGKNVQSIFYVNLNVAHATKEANETEEEFPYMANISLFYHPNTSVNQNPNTFFTEIPSHSESEEENK